MIEILIWGLVFIYEIIRKGILLFYSRFSPTIPIDVVTTMLAYESNEICREHLRSLGIIFIDESIDCKTSRTNFDKT